ncbi:hypothetical protein LCGC14_2609510 [marine sediment metagenome]|uniref:Uncharacterized protein n=1 Tax=marine sediment metagenome TaxID=412755 RepID=A0A0F9A6B1_9ZZZZ
MVSFMVWCQSQYLVWQLSPVEATVSFILSWVGIILAGITLGIVFSEIESGREIR